MKIIRIVVNNDKDKTSHVIYEDARGQNVQLKLTKAQELKISDLVKNIIE